MWYNRDGGRGLRRPDVSIRESLRRALGLAQKMWRGVLALGLLWFGLSPLARAADEPRARAAKVDNAPIIDAILDDPAWQQAEPISDFTQVEPVEGAPPSFRTEVRIVTNNESLFMSLRAFDPEPDKIVANMMGRGEFFLFDDNFTVVFDTFHDHRNGFFIQVNPHGGRRDGTFERENFQENWDGIWYAKARIDERGWVAEIEIPFRTFSIKPGSDEWGFNMTRRIRRLNEDNRWADINVERFLINMGNAGVLEGLAGAQQGLGLDVVPSVSLIAEHDEFENKHEFSVEPSFDAFYRVTPSLTASLTANTDFNQTEVDNQEINSSRFALFFPEKRQYFLEDGGLFNFGGLDQNAVPFFSRRIGLADGKPVRLPVGVKLAGRVGQLNLGLLNVQQDRHKTSETTNLTVARMSANVMEESTAGFIVTHGDPLTDDRNALAGLDFNYRSTSLIPDRFITGDFFFQQSFSGDNDYKERSGSWGMKLAYPNDTIRWDLDYKELQPGFNPGLGFVNRSDIRNYSGEWRYRARPTSGAFRTIDARINASLTTDRRNNNVETWNINYYPVKLTTHIEDSVELRLAHLFDRVPAGKPFFFVPHFGIRNGHYNFPSVILLFETSRNRPLRANLTTAYGGFYDGKGWRIDTFIEWRPSAHWLISIRHDERQFFGLNGFHGGDTTGTGPSRRAEFATRVSRVRLRINFTPDISWSTFIQYDNVSDGLSAQSIFRWIVEEGHDIFLVLGQEVDASPGDLRFGKTRPVARVSWTVRF